MYRINLSREMVSIKICSSETTEISGKFLGRVSSSFQQIKLYEKIKKREQKSDPKLRFYFHFYTFSFVRVIIFVFARSYSLYFFEFFRICIGMVHECLRIIWQILSFFSNFVLVGVVYMIHHESLWVIRHVLSFYIFAPIGVVCWEDQYFPRIFVEISSRRCSSSEHSLEELGGEGAGVFISVHRPVS